LSLVLYDPAQIGIEIPIPQPKGKGVKYRTKTASSTSMERSTARARLNQFTHRPFGYAPISLELDLTERLSFLSTPSYFTMHFSVMQEADAGWQPSRAGMLCN
jgi:hypothetical protein